MLKQTTIIKQEIEGLISKGYVNKKEIYSQVCKNLDVPRPTVRRVAMDLYNDHMRIVKILEPLSK